MKWSLYALLLGSFLDLLIGDPHGFPHPVIAIGKLISVLERFFRRLCPKTVRGEILAGGLIWFSRWQSPPPSRFSFFLRRSEFPSICVWCWRASCAGRFSRQSLCAMKA